MEKVIKNTKFWPSKLQKQAGFPEPHSISTIGWVWVGFGLSWGKDLGPDEKVLKNLGGQVGGWVVWVTKNSTHSGPTHRGFPTGPSVAIRYWFNR